MTNVQIRDFGAPSLLFASAHDGDRYMFSIASAYNSLRSFLDVIAISRVHQKDHGRKTLLRKQSTLSLAKKQVALWLAASVVQPRKSSKNYFRKAQF